MDIHVDIRGFLEIHARICYGFSDHKSALPYVTLILDFTKRKRLFCCDSCYPLAKYSRLQKSQSEAGVRRIWTVTHLFQKLRLDSFPIDL